MSYEAFFVGVGGTVFGTLLGAWFAYRFQQLLLKQQLEFLKQQADEDSKQRAAIAAGQLALLDRASSMLFQIRLNSEAIALALESLKKTAEKNQTRL